MCSVLRFAAHAGGVAALLPGAFCSTFARVGRGIEDEIEALAHFLEESNDNV